MAETSPGFLNFESHSISFNRKLPALNFSFNHLKKNLKKDTSNYKSAKIAILADFASQLFTQAIRGYGMEFGINYQVFEADYDQIDQQVSDPDSELYHYQPDFIVLLRSSEKLIKTFYKAEKESKESFAEEQVGYIDSLYQKISERLKCKVITNTYVEINDSVFGNYATKTKTSFVYQVKKLNFLLMDLCQVNKNLFLSDFASLAAVKGYEYSFDPRMYANADMVFSLDFLPLVAKSIHGIIQAINGTFKKCVILDLDNTTWGGIIGDDGIEGIQIGDLGIGKVFTDFQLWIKQLKKRGIIVAICSKNTEGIAKEPFISHPDMVLRLEDIAVFVANWENKVDNINYIQSVLNIGFDSMVFLDDNPFEREMVKQAIPEITAPALPEDPSEYLMFLRSLNLFETASFTEEDEIRTKQYQEEAKRSILQRSFADEDEFLKRLGMKSDVKAFDQFTILRIAQLSQRSNQFNLRTVRYAEEEVKHIARSEDYYTLSFALEDLYGHYGLIAYVILKKGKAQTLFIDNWVMSCRVLKRGMENFTLNQIVKVARQNGFEKLVGEYLPTPKNDMVKNHYKDLGFASEKNCWLLKLSEYADRKTYIEALLIHA